MTRTPSLHCFYPYWIANPWPSLEFYGLPLSAPNHDIRSMVWLREGRSRHRPPLVAMETKRDKREVDPERVASRLLGTMVPCPRRPCDRTQGPLLHALCSPGTPRA